MFVISCICCCGISHSVGEGGLDCECASAQFVIHPSLMGNDIIPAYHYTSATRDTVNCWGRENMRLEEPHILPRATYSIPKDGRGDNR